MIVRTSLVLILFVVIVESYSSVRNHGRRGLLNTIRIQPTAGEPWPKPQSIQTTFQQFAVLPDKFHFLINETSQSCDILTNAFIRYYKAIFFPQTYLSYVLGSSFSWNTNDYNRRPRVNIRKNLSHIVDVPLLESLNVHVQQLCDQWPSLESNESCKKTYCLFCIIFKSFAYRYAYCQKWLCYSQCGLCLGCITRLRNI